MLGVDISAMPGAVQDELIRGRHAQDTLAILKAPRRQDIQARLHAQDQLKSVDGLGRPRMVIEATAYHYWGRRLGYACWKDPQFLREFERDNPNVRLKAGGTRIQSGYSGKAEIWKAESGNATRRFQKTYA